MKSDPLHPSCLILHTFFQKFDQFADAPNAVAKMWEPSANGARDASLGQRPRIAPPHSSQALKGRHNASDVRARGFPVRDGWAALSGLYSFFDTKPRALPWALPWAGMVRPVGAGGTDA